MSYEDDKGPKPRIAKLNAASESMEKLRVRFSLDKAQFEIIVKTMTEDADEVHLEQFLYSCKNLGLDPVMNQIYMQIRWSWNWKANPKRWDRHVSIQTGIEGLRSLAETTGSYAGQDTPDFYWDNGTGIVVKGPVYPDGANVLAATVTVYRWLEKVGKVAFSHTAYLRDYAQRTRNGGLSGMWEKIGIMLPKCAEAGALRKGWPQVFKNLYIREEMLGETVPEVKEAAGDVKAAEGVAESKEQAGGLGAADPGPDEKVGRGKDEVVEGEGGGVPPDGALEERKAAPLTTQQKATQIVAALKDKHKEKAGMVLKDYISRCAGAKTYGEVPKTVVGSMMDLLHLKLNDPDGAPGVVRFIDQKMAEKPKENAVEQPG